MDLITFAITVALVGFVVWLLVTYVPMPPLVLVLWAVRVFVGPIPSVR
jgi:hypothetical protein